MPTTNCGAETQTKEVTISALSAGRPRRSAATMPMVSPSRSSAKIAAAISTRLAGSRDADQLGHLAALQVGAPEVALQQPAEVAPVLHQERLVEPELGADARHRVGRGGAAGDLPRRVGRQDVEQQEGDEADPEQDQHRRRQPPRRVGHQPRPFCVGSSTSRSASPTRLKASASIRIATPGKKTSQGAVWK